MHPYTAAAGTPRTLLRGTRRIATVVATVLLGLTVASGWAVARSEAHGGANAARAAFQDAMRGLWEEHVTWTRLVIVSFVHDLPDREATTVRLLRNQADIGDAIRPFYGDAAGNALTELLREHILTAADILVAAKAGDTDGLATAVAAWYSNSDAIADFLAAANPRHWPVDEMRAMMRTHLDLTLGEAVAQLEGRYADAVDAYDAVEIEIRQMADMLSDGIIAEFPAAFAH